MKENFETVINIINSIKNVEQVEACNNMIKNFKELHQQEGHDYSNVLLGYLEATIIHKGL